MNVLKINLQKAGINYVAEKEFNVTLEDIVIGKSRCDLLVENKVIIEPKPVTGYQPKLFQSQLISYLKASKVKTGLLINFGNANCEIKRLSV